MGPGPKVSNQGPKTAEAPTRLGVKECIICGGRKGVSVHASPEDGGTLQAVLPLQSPLLGDSTPSEWSRDSASGKASYRADPCRPQSAAAMSYRD